MPPIPAGSVFPWKIRGRVWYGHWSRPRRLTPHAPIPHLRSWPPAAPSLCLEIHWRRGPLRVQIHGRRFPHPAIPCISRSPRCCPIACITLGRRRLPPSCSAPPPIHIARLDLRPAAPSPSYGERNRTTSSAPMLQALHYMQPWTAPATPPLSSSFHDLLWLLAMAETPPPVPTSVHPKARSCSASKKSSKPVVMWREEFINRDVLACF